jgi:hypothetical protein
MNYESIQLENERRKKILFAPYNPLTGEGSNIKRFKMKIADNNKLYLPLPMQEIEGIKKIMEYKSLDEFCRKKKFPFDKTLKSISELRLTYDYEFYAATQQKVLDKKTKKYVPFYLNYPQRKLNKIVQDKIDAGEPIYIKILKARQWGGSTYTQYRMAHIQDMIKENWNSIMVGEVEKQSRYLRALYKRALKYNERKSFTFSSFEGSKNNIVVDQLGCIVSVGSMQKPDSVRCEDNAMAHLTELGLWKTTEGNSPEDLLQSVANSIEPEPYSMFVLESTAKGVGNFWHEIWITENAYTPVFIAWFEIEKNYKSIRDKQKFIDSLNEYEIFLWNSGATLEGINWYRSKLSEMNGDKWRMQAENPTNPREAFQSTGRRVFNPNDVEILRKQATPPRYKGKLEGDTLSGENCIKNLKFTAYDSGEFFIWELPVKGWRNRYLVVADPNKGLSEKADYGVITVFDRIDVVNGGEIKPIARWRGRIDQDLFALIAAQIAEYYNHALLVIENNAMRKTKVTDDENQSHFLTVLNTIVDFYDNLYTYQDLEKVKEGVPVKYGFNMNHQTKQACVDKLREKVRERLFNDPDIRVYDELDTFVISSAGKYEAQQKCHDDIIDTDGIGYLVNDKMILPKKIDTRAPKKVRAQVGLKFD